MEPKFSSNKNCVVCKHPERYAIEAVLYRMTPKDADELLEQLSNAYDIDIEVLQRHAMFHACLDLTPAGEETSIVRQMKLRETDLLGLVAKDYADTLSLIGNRIRTKAHNESDVDGMDDVRFERSITKSLVELYLGCGDNVRKTVKDIADINQVLNGPKDDGLSGLGALAAAIAGSNQNSSNQEDGEN